MPEPRVTAQQRQAMVERAGGCCEYCRSQMRFARGVTAYTKTEGYDPVIGERVMLYHPRQQRWADHFWWSDDFSAKAKEIIGKRE